MKKYLSLLKEVLEEGNWKNDRTGVGIKHLFAERMQFDLSNGFPAVTTKKLMFSSVKAELLWFLEGTGDIKSLQEKGCNIWNENVEAWDGKEFETDAGRPYGVQWRNWENSDGEKTDQIAKAINKIKNIPYSRRILVSAWNPGELDQMVLPPCHAFFQFDVTNGELKLQMYQRSADMFLGVPFNIASYALLLHMVAQVTGYKPTEFTHVIGSAHIYKNHMEQVKKQLSREPLPRPELHLNPGVKDIDDFTMDDIELKDYQHHPHIEAPMAV